MNTLMYFFIIICVAIFFAGLTLDFAKKIVQSPFDSESEEGENNDSTTKKSSHQT